MDLLKKFFPFAFNVKDGEPSTLVIAIVIHAVASLVINLALSLVGLLIGGIAVIGPVYGVISGFVGSVIGLYCTAGIVFSILKFCKVLK